MLAIGTATLMITSASTPLPRRSAAEARVAELDEATGASLKLTVLNPRGRVWLMVAGGGASVIYADTVGDLGCAAELGNYGEYSGGPNTAETYQVCTQACCAWCGCQCCARRHGCSAN
jgi:succinyl-CoA synthetase beta subunit